jgi:hypothetical protein|tara:strand:+ start:2116 stop:2334 length:219 start_codon:yes stop_codon:yes gene_type:complete
MIEKLYRFSLDTMERFDKRTNYFEKLGHKFANKIYQRAFRELYDMSPYENIDDHDRWQDEQEYRARMSEDGA